MYFIVFPFTSHRSSLFFIIECNVIISFDLLLLHSQFFLYLKGRKIKSNYLRTLKAHNQQVFNIYFICIGRVSKRTKGNNFIDLHWWWSFYGLIWMLSFVWVDHRQIFIVLWIFFFLGNILDWILNEWNLHFYGSFKSFARLEKIKNNSSFDKLLALYNQVLVWFGLPRITLL